MAFPASPSNNQIHKETGTNRLFVYDSTLGVWDQVKEPTSRPTNSQFGSTGKVIQVVHNHLGREGGSGSGYGYLAPGAGAKAYFSNKFHRTQLHNFTLGNSLLVWISGGSVYQEDTGTDYRSRIGCYVTGTTYPGQTENRTDNNYYWGGVIKGEGAFSPGHGGGSHHSEGTFIGGIVGYGGTVSVYPACAGDSATGRWVLDQNSHLIGVILMEVEGNSGNRHPRIRDGY